MFGEEETECNVVKYLAHQGCLKFPYPKGEGEELNSKLTNLPP